MSAARDASSPGGDLEGLDPTPPEGGYELYRHKNAGGMETRNWHGLYWARRNEEGDYEIRSVPTSLGETSVPGGILSKDGFEEHYVRVIR